MAGDLAKGRPYADHESLFRKADALLFALSEESLDDILQAYPAIGIRPGSEGSAVEQCSPPNSRPGVMHMLDSSARRYVEKFGFGFVMHIPVTDDDDTCLVSAVIDAIADRMHNDPETERKVLRNEIAKLNRTRLERMLGPEGGYDNWI